MKIALAQINPTVGDIRGNLSKIVEFARNAQSEGSSLVVFPEMAIGGYPPMDLLLKDSFIRANLTALETLAQKVTDIAIVVGFVDRNTGSGRPLYNGCALLQGGKIILKQYKTLLPTYDVFDEDRYFEPASQYHFALVDGKRIGFSICEDIWNYAAPGEGTRYHADPVEKVAALGVDIILNISCSPFDVTKYEVREELIRQHAARHRVPIIYVNQVGGNDQLIFDGRSSVIDAGGRLAARAAAFEEDILTVNYDEVKKSFSGEIKDAVADRVAETYAALVLGTRDYLSKCGFKKVVIGLSGGIDSAVTCAIACNALGKENVTGIAMPSPYSSPGSVADAQQLADNLGISMKIIPIESAMLAFGNLLEPAWNDISGASAGVAAENIQARIRGTILMALSNESGALVLATGNKSELAVGYCTLYGDMAGGLAVISDVPKMQVYALAEYINRQAGYDLIPRASIEKAPSAELRPNQKDQDSLPPYPVLDGIINAYVEQRLKSDQIINLGFPADVVTEVIGRIDRNEYKRKQAAPGLKISTTAFGVGWRMPIAQRFDERLDTQNDSTLQVLC